MLDEQGGLEVADSAGGLGGTLTNFENDDDSQWVDGKIDGALDLSPDATLDNQVDFSLNAVDATQTGGFTIALWVNPGETIVSEVDREWTLVDNGTFGFNLRSNPSFDRVLLFWDTNFDNLTVGSTTLEPGNWYHVAVTSEGAGGAKKYYVNGEEEVSRLFAPANGGQDVATLNGWDAGLARIGDAGGRNHDSLIDDVWIYDVALTQEEVAALLTGPPAFPLELTNLNLPAKTAFHVAAEGFRFSASPVGDGATLSPGGIRVLMNGVDVSPDLVIGGTSRAGCRLQPAGRGDALRRSRRGDR